MMDPRETAVLDGNAAALGVPTWRLMEAAGRAVAAQVLALSPRRVLVLCGPGNNGGDGLVAARVLSAHGPVSVVTSHPAARLRGLAREALRLLPRDVPVVEGPSQGRLEGMLAEADVVVDALVGAGLAGPLREPVRGMVEAANRRARRIVSVDVPSGLGHDGAVRPVLTVALHDVKEGTTEANSGRIVVADIGIPPEASRFTGPGELALYPSPSATQHKGEAGVVLVLGGGPYTGAPILSALGALRAGAGMAVVLSPRRAAEIVSAASPNIVVRSLNNYDLDLGDRENLPDFEQWLARADAVVIGPGIGRSETASHSVSFAMDRFRELRKPVVVDADGLHALAREKRQLTPLSVATPHAGEFKALAGEPPPPEDRPDERALAVRTLARRLDGTVLLKGATTIVSDSRREKLSRVGSPAMAVGGTGDVLSGVVGALLAKRLSPFDAARVGAYIQGRAGEIASQERSYGMLATDLLEAIPRVLPAAPRRQL
ncbi:MAG TPA: NAD(P)H-hydrate dehydratase [Candidatus Thermoplasmatota archaeon]|nr:NAD(P)H-hydrate dehydratase [Candidatus Thermoplasmatota archaeon]